MAKCIEYCIKHGLSYLQGIKPNENYCGSGAAPTMGARHSFCEYKTVWGEKPKYFEPLTTANYIKIIFEENRWEKTSICSFSIIQKSPCNTKCEFATVYDGEKRGECHCVKTWKKCEVENCTIEHNNRTGVRGDKNEVSIRGE